MDETLSKSSDAEWLHEEGRDVIGRDDFLGNRHNNAVHDRLVVVLAEKQNKNDDLQVY